MAIIEPKEKKGSSRQSILQYLLANFEVENSAAHPLMNRAIKNMSTAGRLVLGAPAGRNGAGCFELSAEEKMSSQQAEKDALKKVDKAGKKVEESGKGTNVKKTVAMKGAEKKIVVTKTVECPA
eukprot:GFUD01112725.1.p2 GENE.GFUD01112725.1~~GFUD01112725.1.p2  ORF type:complete len:136 (-),score=29.63 GFUD01112725.1:362-733(-)